MEIDWVKGIPEFLKVDVPIVNVRMAPPVEIRANHNPTWVAFDWVTETVTVQPMAPPAGLIFYLNYQYAKQGIKLSEFKFTDWEFK